ncbi:MAG: hypothetical protein QXH13_03150, partial [Thermoplasmata archaeon]
TYAVVHITEHTTATHYVVSIEVTTDSIVALRFSTTTIDSVTIPSSQSGVSYIRYPDSSSWYGWTDIATEKGANVPEHSQNILIFAGLILIPILWRRKWLKKNVRFAEQS